MSRTAMLTEALTQAVMEGIDAGLTGAQAAEACGIPRAVHLGWMMTGAEDTEAGRETAFSDYRAQVMSRWGRARLRGKT